MQGNQQAKALGLKIRAARKRLGITQLCLGTDLGYLSGGSIHLWESGAVLLPPKQVERLCAILHLSPDEIRGEILDIRRKRMGL